MLSPVSNASTISPVVAQRDVPVVTQALATLVATPDAAIALSLAANSEVEGKLNMLLIAARERMIDSLFAVVDAVSQSLAMQPAAEESNVNYALRLAQTINDLPPNQVASVQQQLNAQGQTAPLALVARALQNPAGTEAAQVVAYMEVVRYKEKDLATKAVVASYGQNGAEEPDAAPALQTAQQSISGNITGNTATAPSKLPVAGAPVLEAAAALPQATKELAPTANAGGPQAPAPLANAAAAQSVATSSTLSTPVPSGLPAAPALQPTAEVSTVVASPTLPSTSMPSSPESQTQATVASPATVPASKNELAAAPLGQSSEAGRSALFNMPKSAPTPLPAATSSAPMASPQVPANVISTARPTNVPVAASQPQAAVVPGQALSAQPVSSETIDLLPIIAAFTEGAIQPAQSQLPSGAKEAVSAPQLQQKTGPVAAPSQSGSAAPILSDFKDELKVAVDRLVSAIGAELLQTMAEVEPVAEKIVAQALVADMLDNAELGTLPSPDDAVLPEHAAPTSVLPATIQDNPAEELSSLIALNQMLKEATPAAQAAALQQPLPIQFPVGVPFAVAQYLPAEDVVGRDESLHVDRVDAVDDEEHEEEEGKRGEEAEDEAAEEQQEFDEAALVASAEIEADDVASATVDLIASRPLALPRPAPMEPIFNLYQRMGGWE